MLKFREVQVRQLLTQDQLRDVVALAKGTEHVYHPPGASAVERP
jgi:hypothetical protein